MIKHWITRSLLIICCGDLASCAGHRVQTFPASLALCLAWASCTSGTRTFRFDIVKRCAGVYTMYTPALLDSMCARAIVYIRGHAASYDVHAGTRSVTRCTRRDTLNPGVFTPGHWTSLCTSWSTLFHDGLLSFFNICVSLDSFCLIWSVI
jgi:hypothetical protein